MKQGDALTFFHQQSFLGNTTYRRKLKIQKLVALKLDVYLPLQNPLSDAHLNLKTTDTFLYHLIEYDERQVGSG